MKEILQKLRTTVPVIRFMHLDDNVREYLLYMAILAHSRLNKVLTIPDYLRTRPVSSREFMLHGAELAGKDPGKHTSKVISEGGRREGAPEERPA